MAVLDAQVKTMVNRCFFCVSEEDRESYRSQFPQKLYKSIPETKKIHHLINVPSFEDGVFIKNFSCPCSHCLQPDYTQCIYVQRSDSISREKTDTILPKLHDFYEEEQGYRDHYDFEESDEEDFLVTEASHMISSCDIALVKTGNDYPYYLVELICYQFTTESETKDHYNHTHPPEHRIVIGNYLEIHTKTLRME